MIIYSSADIRSHFGSNPVGLLCGRRPKKDKHVCIGETFFNAADDRFSGLYLPLIKPDTNPLAD
jgi:hypothetical protein